VFASSDAGVADALPFDVADASSTDAGHSADGGTADATPSDASAHDAGATADASNLGWPFDAAVPEPCPPADDPPADPWTGWANLQHPASVSVAAGATTPAIYGQVYRASHTEAAGAATGWQAQLAIGPWGSTPTEERGRCFRYEPATFNVDVANNDEWQATATLGTNGLYGAYFRYRPPNGQWRYGDLTGSDDGLAAADALPIIVSGGGPAPLVVVTLNLRCRADDWTARRPLVIRALSRVRPDVVAFQEDCAEGSGEPQSHEVRRALSTFTNQGYQIVRAVTHEANHGGQAFSEGISIMSAHQIMSERVLDISSAVFPRKAIRVEVDVRGASLIFYGTHFEFGRDHAAVRESAARAILADAMNAQRVFFAGDLNDTPGSLAVDALSARWTDLWEAANPTDPGATFPASGPQRRIDFIFSDRAAPLGARLLDDTESGVLLSDHYGVAVAVPWP